MSDIRLPRGLCATIAEFLVGSHATLDVLFISAGASGEPPNLSHATKWKTWMFDSGRNPDVDSLGFLGNLIEEFMDVPPTDEAEKLLIWEENRKKVANALESYGLRYFRGGRVLPNDAGITKSSPIFQSEAKSAGSNSLFPSGLEDLLNVLVTGIPRAMHPLAHRRKGVPSLDFSTEWDLQDLLHAMMRPWVGDIRPEEFTPSYAGTSTRMDFLLPKHSLVIELKYVRDRAHGKRIGNELIIDIEHYRRHPDCSKLWCAVYDPNKYLQNAEGLIADLSGNRSMTDGSVETTVFVV